MAFTVAASGTGASLEPACTPHEISVGLVNDGSGGLIYITQGAGAPGGTFYPAVFFAPAFSGIPWLAFFNKTFATVADAAKEFWRTYSVTMIPLIGTTLPMPDVTLPSLQGGKAMLLINSADTGEAGAQQWRMEIRLRNTSTR